MYTELLPNIIVERENTFLIIRHLEDKIHLCFSQSLTQYINLYKLICDLVLLQEIKTKERNQK